MIVGLMVLLDVYVFQAIRIVAPDSPKLRTLSYIIYWAISIACVIVLLLLPNVNYASWPKILRTYVFAIVVGLFFSKLIAVVFLAVDDLRRMSMWMLGKLFSNPSVEVSQSAEGITRSTFMSWLGLTLGGSLFATLLYGFSNKYRYEVRKIKLAFPKLPRSFHGLKIVHISDIHCGSFTDKSAVHKGVDKILHQHPDLILFTGDLVNDRASEMQEYMEVFSRLQAPLGVFSTLGNHDYGDYVRWESPEAKVANLERLKAVHRELGWTLLVNEHVILDKDGEQIALLGIENWGAKGNFPKYGKMELAYPGTEHYPFKILLSHDPSHWEAEVVPHYPDIDLMLAGHTHGMQFGVEIPGWRWSPVQYLYKQWAGLYQRSSQSLYVNRGFGFLGYPGRVGILPEITTITLTG